MKEKILTKESSRLEAQAFVAETLRHMAKINGCLVLLNFIIQPFHPANRARLELENDEWEKSIRYIFEGFRYWENHMHYYLANIKNEELKEADFQAELNESLGPKIMQFYLVLWSVIRNVVPEEQISEAIGRSPLYNLKPKTNFVESAQLAANLNEIKDLFAVPASFEEQLALLNVLGSQVFRNWKTVGIQEHTTPKS